MKEQNPTLINKYTDWGHFNHLLDNDINLMVPLKAKNQLEKELNAFTVAIQEAAQNSTAVIKTKLKGYNYPKEIRVLMSEKRKLRRKWHQSKSSYDKNLLSRATRQLKISNKHQSTSFSQNLVLILTLE